MALHPEAIKLVNALASKSETFRVAKVDIEMLRQQLEAKGLLPDINGSLPDTLGIVDGFIGGPIGRDSDTSAVVGSINSGQAYLYCLMAYAALIKAATESIFPGGPTVEEAIIAFARG